MENRPERVRRSPLDRYSALVISVAAAMWAADAFFRPGLVNPKGWDLSSSEVVFGESLLISLCFVPVLGTALAELRRASWRTWLALVAIAAGPQAIATVLFTQSLTYAFAPSLSHAASVGIQSEVYLLYLLQPVFGATMAWLFLRERRRPDFWLLAALALVGAALIVFSFNTAVPRAQLLAAAYVVGAVVLWAAGTVLGRYALSDVSFTTTSAMRFTMALPVLLGLMVSDDGLRGFSRYALGELPSFLGIALVPGVVAMVLYYRALRSTPASVSSFAELGYPAALFLIYSLPAPVGFGSPLHPLEVVGAAVLVGAVTGLNVLKGRGTVTVALS